ncbi:integrator complex subunit 12 [Erpetoichthys calabaricus]|uniref:Integrator complex subunit 12 n=1 Tax=Erpetoichthys calabaricus TaxID=27687 RepID=A0A8C4SIG4_ERPCA|nr:integrator complex subunit 12 [Erpetoichthys calabaricus]
MAGTVSFDLDPIFLKGLGYLHSKSKDSAEKLKALLDDSLARGNDSSYRTAQKELEVIKVSASKTNTSKQESKSSSASSLSSNNGKSSSSEKTKKEAEKRPPEKVKVELSDGIDLPKKSRLEKSDGRSSPITVQTIKDLPIPDLSSFDETSADDFAMEMGLACVECRQMTVTSGNQLVECQECHNLYHQDCHKPQVTDKDVNDPRLVWYCARCTRQMKRMAQKTQKPPQKAATAVASSAPVVKDTLVKKPEIKPKQETTATFQAFKRTELKASTTVSGSTTGASASISAASGLTGWAAFGAKTSTAVPASTKLGTPTPSTSGKVTTTSGSQKPVGLGLASVKTTLGSKMSAGSNNNNSSGSSNPPPLKPPPPLTLGKPGLSRSSSSDNVSKVGLPGPSSSPSTVASPVNSGNGAAANGTNNGAKVVVDASSGVKVPTSQESQLNAMKRLQMVKKKAAQKKLKK